MELGQCVQFNRNATLNALIRLWDNIYTRSGVVALCMCVCVLL